MKYTIPAGTYFGIPVRIHFTFPLILAFFGVGGWMGGTWLDGIRSVVLVLLVFLCVVLHEFGHSLQVKRYGITVRDIVLLPIGGMARAERIPERPREEIIVAISGPLVNFVLALGFFLLLRMQGLTPLSAPESLLADLFFINLVLGTFNLIPAYPMDGGRILRGLLATRVSYLRATRLAKSVGQVIALIFVVVGFANTSFLMLPVIAVFIFLGGNSEEMMIRVRTLLEDRCVGDFVDRSTAPVTAMQSIGDASAALNLSRGEAIAVLDDTSAFAGAVFASDISRAISRGESGAPVVTIVRNDFPILPASTPAIEAYYFLKSQPQRICGVVLDGSFVGIVHFSTFLKEGKDVPAFPSAPH